MKKHNKLQQLTFFMFVHGLMENKYLNKIVDKLKRNVSLPQREYIQQLIYDSGVSVTEKESKLITLIYCLHVAKPKDGYIDMLVKSLIEETNVKVSEEEIKRINNLLSDVLDSLNMPELSLDREIAKNIAHYSPSFKKKYGRFIEQ